MTTAHVLATLHESTTGRIARSATPLDLAGREFLDSELGVWLVSAGGGNPDILRALDEAFRHEPRHVAALCARTGSRLATVAAERRHLRLFEFDNPAGGDGFLATNSLLASVTLFTRAYAEALMPCDALPDDLDALLEVQGASESLAGRVAEVSNPLWERRTTLVLHGAGTSAASVDLESKFNEAALGHFQAADWRNFGHGRHHWLARHGRETAVLAITTDADLQLAERTLHLLPASVEIVRIHVPGSGSRTQLGAVLASILLAGAAGAARGVDPGRPGVPRFGSRLYRLSMGNVSVGKPLPGRVLPIEVAAIERKAHASVATLHCRGELAAWRRAYVTFRKRVEAAVFGGVVLDYDGTLVDELHRMSPPGEEIAMQLTRLLRAGVRIGIATGRGGSARDDLRRVLDPALWPMVTLGYYNGAETGVLGDDAWPDSDAPPCDDLSRVRELIGNDEHLMASCSCRARQWQITVEPQLPGATIRIWERIQQLVRSEPGLDVAVVRSGHSIDVVPGHVSKRNLVETVQSSLEPERAVLCIGDRGSWPGNDFALLDHPHGLSVDEVSADPGTCWNLAPRGVRGARATAAYLKALVSEPGLSGPAIRFRTSGVKDT
jgi:hypothetical protein